MSSEPANLSSGPLFVDGEKTQHSEGSRTQSHVSGRVSPSAEVTFASNKPISVSSLSCHIEDVSAGHSWMQHSAKGPLAGGVEVGLFQSGFASKKRLSQKAYPQSSPSAPDALFSSWRSPTCMCLLGRENGKIL